MKSRLFSPRPVKPLPANNRRLGGIADESLVREGNLGSTRPFPLLLEPAHAEVDLSTWAISCRDFLERRLASHGAILFRNFSVQSVAEFEKVVHAVGGEAMEYAERTSPRSQLGRGIYTSTDYPADQPIFLHNELSYATTFPLKIFFFCVKPAARGGETPIADTRAILDRIEPEVRDRFVRSKYRYVRNIGDHLGLPWKAVFQTTDQREVEAYCRRARIAFEWKDQTRLRTWQIRPVIAKHPRNGEMVWFNHATFFHVTTLAPKVRRILTEAYGEDSLPNNTYYGDGTPIESKVMAQLRAAYEEETISFCWQKGDILLLDNMLVAHGRRPYTGDRQVVVAMTDPFTRNSEVEA